MRNTRSRQQWCRLTASIRVPLPFIGRTGLRRSNDSRRQRVRNSKAIPNGEGPPAQGVCGDARACWRPLSARRRWRRPISTGPAATISARRSRRRPEDCALLASATAAAAPGASTIPRRQRRGVLAGEHRAGARAGRLLHLRCPRRRRDRAAHRHVETSIDRFGGDFKNFELNARRRRRRLQGRLHRRQAVPRLHLCPSRLCRQDAHCFLKKEIKPPRRKAGFTSGVVRQSVVPAFAGTTEIIYSTASTVTSGQSAFQRSAFLA